MDECLAYGTGGDLHAKCQNFGFNARKITCDDGLYADPIAKTAVKILYGSDAFMGCVGIFFSSFKKTHVYHKTSMNALKMTHHVIHGSQIVWTV